MAGHLVSTLVSGFHTDLEPAHFWSQGPLMNGVRRWQLIIKPDFIHLFHSWTLGVRPSVRVYQPADLWSQGPLENGVRSWQLIVQPDFIHLFHGRTLGLRLSVRVVHQRGQMWNRPTSGGRVPV